MRFHSLWSPWLAAAVTLCTLKPAVCQETPECFAAGECTQSPYVGDWPSDGAQHCLEQCQDEQECQVFTHYGDQDLCVGFAACQKFSSTTCDDCYSGNRTCEDLQCWTLGRCDGGQIVGEFSADRDSDCLEACRQDDACAWFSYNADDRGCFLLATCPLLDRSCSTCLSGQVQCEDREDFTKLVVIAGDTNPDPTAIDDVDLVDLTDPSNPCTMPNYPIPLWYGAAALVGGENRRIMHCGGTADGVVGFTECYDYLPESNEWVLSDEALPEAKFAMASSMVGDEWFITGGQVGGVTVSTSHVWTEENGFAQGPILPTPVLNHCQVTLNSSAVLITGYGSATYLLDWDRKEWHAMPSLNVSRTQPACGLVFTEDNGYEVVVGGDGTSEIFSLDDLAWRQGPLMPISGSYFSSTQLGGTFAAAGGFSKFDNGTINLVTGALPTIYRFDPDRYEWSLQGSSMETPRCCSPTVAVPDEFLNRCTTD